jgi:predicted AAA+ superfamily ATPase
MYLRRKIDEFLINWKKQPDRKPLIIKGARQTGKTYSILHFIENNYKNKIYINFALEPKFKRITDDGYIFSDVIKNISRISPNLVFEPNNTVIVFDELQEHPDIATSLKSFCLDGTYDVICSGSLLGLHYKKIHSNSVGYKTDYELRSFDFEEFLWAKGYKDSFINDLFENMKSLKPLSNVMLEICKNIFVDFCILGGMPAVIKQYIETGLFSKTLEIQNQIALDYEEDIRKYAESLDQTKIISMFRNIPSQLAKENKKYQFNKINKNSRARDFQGCKEWLSDAGVINICYCLNYPELPLKGNYNETKFKLYYADTGLLIASLDDEAQEDLRANKNLGVYKGALYENFIAEALVKQDFKLYYYSKENSTLEEDFFVRSTDELIPLEVKSNNHNSKSLSTLIKSNSYKDIKYGIKLHAGNIGYSNNIYSFPYFCAFLLKRFIKN